MNSPKFSKNAYFQVIGRYDQVNQGFIHQVKNVNNKNYYEIEWKNWPNKIYSYVCEEVDFLWEAAFGVFVIDSEKGKKNLVENIEKRAENSCENGDHKMVSYLGLRENFLHCEKCGFK